MDFTREPIVQTVITPREGFKLVVRSSKGVGQEEYFVDAIEVVTFGQSSFFRSLEKPKSFLVPVSDYEILEVREARMILKNVGMDKSIKIGGGREAPMRPPREEKAEEAAPEPTAAIAEGEKVEKKRDRRTRHRRRRGREEVKEGVVASSEEASKAESEGKIILPEPRGNGGTEAVGASHTPSLLSTLLPPPPTLISETIARYKDNAQFKGAFYTKEEAAEAAAREGTEEDDSEETTAGGYPSLDVIDEVLGELPPLPPIPSKANNHKEESWEKEEE